MSVSVNVNVNVNLDVSEDVEGDEYKRKVSEGLLIAHHQYCPQYGRYVSCPRMMCE